MSVRFETFFEYLKARTYTAFHDRLIMAVLLWYVHSCLALSSVTMILTFSLAQTDEQAPLPGALSQLLMRVCTGLQSGRPADFVFNCQMGRGRTTSGMVTACLIATTMTWEHEKEEGLQEDEDQSAKALDQYDSIDGPSEEEAYLQGELWLELSCHETLRGLVDSEDCG